MRIAVYFEFVSWSGGIPGIQKPNLLKILPPEQPASLEIQAISPTKPPSNRVMSVH
jgi:hypothetical protein